MALGGGNWTYSDKILPGTYVNFTNPLLVNPSLSQIGIVAVPLALNWGTEGEIITLNSDTIESDCQRLLGYKFADEKMLAIRELFANARIVYAYRLSTDSTKATNIYATALHGGTRGNDLKITISSSIDREDYFRVNTYLESYLVDSQEVLSSAELKDNDYVTFVKNSVLANTAGLTLSGGTDGDAITGANYQNFLSCVESYFFDILCCPTTDPTTINYFMAFTKRMNTETGSNFQMLCYRANSADSEHVISLQNKSESSLGDSGLVYWLSGALSSCECGQSLTGKIYKGELKVDTAYSQSELMSLIRQGNFVFHSANGQCRVLRDINSLVTFDYDKGEDFSSNQTVRVCFSVSNSIASLFNTKYLGLIANDSAGRMSLWNDVCTILKQLENVRAISNFNTQNVMISQGDSKNSVICKIGSLEVSGAMEALYINVIII